MKQLSLLTLMFLFTLGYSQETLDYSITERYDAITGTYNISDKETYSYDSSGNVSQITYSSWDEQTKNWINFAKDEYTYDTSGNMSSNSYYNLSNSSWVPSYKTEYSYINNSVQVSNILDYNWDGIQWVYYYKSDIIYDSGKIKSYMAYNWVNNQWVIDERANYVYTGDYLQSYSVEEFENGAWVLEDKEVFTRNATTHKIEQISYQRWDGTSWVEDSNENFEYDLNENRLREYFSYNNSNYKDNIEYSYDDSALISNYYSPFNKEKFLVDLELQDQPHHNKVLTEISSIFENNSWLLYSRKTHYYSDSILSIKDVDGLNKITVYPNPVETHVNFNLTKNTTANVSIYDVNGRQVLTQKIDNFNNSLNLEGLKSGLYLCKIYSEGTFVVKQIIKK